MDDQKQWRANWWDVYPLLNRPKRPLLWSSSSVIFTAHPSQPIVTARHFSSSKQFTLPSPSIVLSFPASYAPPSLISVSPCDRWLFAFFPRRDVEGTCCLWNRGPQLDNWQVREFWSPGNTSPVTAAWLSNNREWASTAAGQPIRLPLRGPRSPFSQIVLLLVTQDNNLHVNYYRPNAPGIKTIKRPLSVPGITTEINQTSPDALENINGLRQCVDAAIGLGYNDNSIIIASRCRRMPMPVFPPPPVVAPFNSMDLSVPTDLSSSSLQNQKPPTGRYGVKTAQSRSRKLTSRSTAPFFVRRFFHSIIGSLLSFPGVVAQPVSYQAVPNASFSGFSFLTAPPYLDNDQRQKSPNEKGALYFMTSSVDFHGYSSPPTSTLSLYAITSKNSPNARSAVTSCNLETSRTVEGGVFAHFQSFIDPSSPSRISLHTYVLRNSGPMPSGNIKGKVPIAELKVLSLPGLADNPNFEPVDVLGSADSLSRDLPIYASVSPNTHLLCTLSSSLWKNQVALHLLPKIRAADGPAPASLSIVSAILGKISTEDVIHCISSQQYPLSEAQSVIHHALVTLESFKAELPHSSLSGIVGLMTEVYRTRAKLSKDEKEKEVLEDKWHTAHDICSLVACIIAFEECKDDAGYDLEAVWQIIAICSWVVRFTEKLLKTIVLSNGYVNAQKGEGSQPEGTLVNSSLLHIGHPFLLQNVIKTLNHVTAIRSYLALLPAGGENAHMAQTILLDAVDSSGISFEALIPLLENALTVSQQLSIEEYHKSLAMCQPTPAMQQNLIELIPSICNSNAITNRTALFIKPIDFVEGATRLSLSSTGDEEENDVITKGALTKQGAQDSCLRCGGRTSGSKNMPKVLGQGLEAPQWIMWERMWQLQCICGGAWVSTSIH